MKTYSREDSGKQRTDMEDSQEGTKGLTEVKILYYKSLCVLGTEWTEKDRD